MTLDIASDAVLAPSTFVELSGMTIGYGAKVAVRDIDLRLGPGEFVSIIGPSGCGKSTLLHVLAGLKQPLTGRITMGDEDVTHCVGKKLRTGYVFQDHRLLPWRTGFHL